MGHRAAGAHGGFDLDLAVADRRVTQMQNLADERPHELELSDTVRCRDAGGRRFVLSGRWPVVTGADFADWITLFAVLEGDTGTDAMSSGNLLPDGTVLSGLLDVDLPAVRRAI